MKTKLYSCEWDRAYNLELYQNGYGYIWSMNNFSTSAAIISIHL